jgi:hypothetical protein
MFMTGKLIGAEFWPSIVSAKTICEGNDFWNALNASSSKNGRGQCYENHCWLWPHVSGLNVMILKILSPKKIGENFGVFVSS